jgi:RNA polymerase sigma factor for flagellar operon FliA
MVQEREIAAALPIVQQEASIAKRRYPRVEREELVGVGQVALVEAATRFRTDRGATFRHFARLRVRGAMIDLIRYEIRRRLTAGRAVRVESLHDLDERHEPCAAGTPDTMLEQLATIELVAGLPERERAVIIRTRIDGESCLDVAEDLGVSAARVSQLAWQAEARLRREAA